MRPFLLVPVLLLAAQAALAQPATSPAPMPGPVGTNPGGAQPGPGASLGATTVAPAGTLLPGAAQGVVPPARLGTTALPGTSGAGASVGSSAGGPGAIGTAGSTIGSVGTGGSGAGSGTGIGLNTH